MASFYAELQVAGRTYPVRHCTYEFLQATSERGRVSAKVRHGLVHLTLDVPDDEALLSWAATPNQPLAGRVVFRNAQGGAALETLAWEAGQCVGYQEEFLSGSLAAGAYVCHLTIAAPQLTMQPGGPATYVAPAAGEHGGPQQAGMPVLEPEVVEEILAAQAGRAILERIAQGVLRLLTSAPALTAALLLLPTNSRKDDGYKAEWDLSKLTQAPTDKDRTRLDYLEKEREHRPLTEAEEDELAGLLAIVRKVFIGGRQGLPGYYAQQAAAAHLRQIVPEFREVRILDAARRASGEFDGINMKEGLFIEDKSAEGLNTINPRTGLKAQTAEEWAQKNIFKKTAKRIDSLAGASTTLPSKGGTPTVPDINKIRGFRRLHFRVEADVPEVRKAVDIEVQNLRIQYPDWDFTAQYGK